MAFFLESLEVREKSGNFLRPAIARKKSENLKKKLKKSVNLDGIAGKIETIEH